jgi:hypothetical protein
VRTEGRAACPRTCNSRSIATAPNSPRSLCSLEHAGPPCPMRTRRLPAPIDPVETTAGSLLHPALHGADSPETAVRPRTSRCPRPTRVIMARRLSAQDRFGPWHTLRQPPLFATILTSRYWPLGDTSCGSYLVSVKLLSVMLPQAGQAHLRPPHRPQGPRQCNVQASAARGLLRVGCMRLIMIEASPSAYPSGMLALGKMLTHEEETACESIPSSTHFTAGSTCMPAACRSVS